MWYLHKLLVYSTCISLQSNCVINHSIFTLCIFILYNGLLFFSSNFYALFHMHVYFAFTIKCILWNNEIKIIYGVYKCELYCVTSVKCGECKHVLLNVWVIFAKILSPRTNPCRMVVITTRIWIRLGREH